MVNRPIFSTDGGRIGPKRAQKPAPKSTGPVLPDDGFVRLFREKGGRGGKTVTVVRGLKERGEALEAIAGELKRLCGAGGTAREDVIEVQGDHRERIAEKLRSMGYKVKLAGG